MMDSGEQSMTMDLIKQMLMWSVNSLDITELTDMEM